MQHERRPGTGVVDQIAYEVLRLDEHSVDGEGLPFADQADYAVLKALLAKHEDAADMAAQEGQTFAGYTKADGLLFDLGREQVGHIEGVRCNLYSANGAQATCIVGWENDLGVVTITGAMIKGADGFTEYATHRTYARKDFLQALTASEAGPVYVLKDPAKERTAGMLGRLFRRRRQ
jgi:hypothetical protein